ncbi:uncharacterized protein LOC115218753 [Octopus sinensis]|uniref:Uncharacterized protein LOC115218753 n=1 Tax=Octopus sinensis TaxID=2607531 RepID=A0A6P7T2C4_9MOLL|nr:uncharacterized protein LOC115218753 [Octopus sinensis]
MTKTKFKLPASDEIDWYDLQGKGVTFHNCLRNTTTTKLMLEEPFLKISKERANDQPLPFHQKTMVNYKNAHKFSEHDNRNIFDTDSAFFDFGRRCAGRRQVNGENFFNQIKSNLPLRMDDTDVIPISTYSASFQRLGHLRQSVSYRRFPKKYPNLQPGATKLGTDTTTWYASTDEHKDSSQLLRNSLPICTKGNLWKFSYRGSTNVYPT